MLRSIVLTCYCDGMATNGIVIQVGQMYVGTGLADKLRQAGFDVVEPGRPAHASTSPQPAQAAPTAKSRYGHDPERGGAHLPQVLTAP